MLADIAAGETGIAELFLVIAIVLFIIAGVGYTVNPNRPIAVGWFGLAFVALALLLL